MRPEDIRRIYAEEAAADDAEAHATQTEARTDPEAARKLLAVLYAMSVEDRSFALLLRLFMEGTTMRYIEERMAADDAEALKCSNLIVDLMQATMQRTPRGRQSTKTTRSA
jgi:hypothetical protein